MRRHANPAAFSSDVQVLLVALAKRWERGKVPYTRSEIAALFGWSLERVRDAFNLAARDRVVRLIPRRARAYGLTRRGQRLVYGPQGMRVSP